MDDRARHAIADALGVELPGVLIEIGPGHGAITEIVAARCRRLVAVELDAGLAAELRADFRDRPQVEIVEQDILKADIGVLIGADRPAAVVGNLPYYITSEILLALFAAAREGWIGRAVLMMQREVAQRLSARPGTRDFGLLSATAQMHGHVEELFTLPPEAFSPPPEVYSTVVRVEFAPRFAELGVDWAGFDLFLKRCFAQKRKTLRNNLRVAGYLAPEVAASWPGEMPEQVRAEAVGLEGLAELYNGLRRRG